jgi:TonB family protein
MSDIREKDFMAAGSQVREWSGPSRRRVPRFRIQAPLDVTVIRSGISDTVPGRSVNVGERGIAAIFAGELVPGETVGVDVRLSPSSAPIQTSATVKYQDRLRCGLEFATISLEQRLAIREWAKSAKAEAEVGAVPPSRVSRVEVKQIPPSRTSFGGGGSRGGRKGNQRNVGWIVALAVLAIAALVFWWRWNRGWAELESGLKIPGSTAVDKAPVQVPPEVMQKLLVHRVDPVYPLEARKQNLQGIIALDIVVARDGSVVSTHALNGPDVLAHAASDALRWWKFEPYRVNGAPVAVETTVAVEFK